MWSLNKIHQIGELLAAVAVVISLVFVGLEVRDNTIASRAATHLTSVAYDIDVLMNVGASPDTARVYRAFRDEPHSLQGDEYLQGEYLFIALYRHNENIYLQYLAGMLSNDVWATREPFLRGFIQTPGFDRLTTGAGSGNYGGPFLDFAERVRSEVRGGNGATTNNE